MAVNIFARASVTSLSLHFIMKINLSLTLDAWRCGKASSRVFRVHYAFIWKAVHACSVIPAPSTPHCSHAIKLLKICLPPNYWRWVNFPAGISLVGGPLCFKMCLVLSVEKDPAPCLYVSLSRGKYSFFPGGKGRSFCQLWEMKLHPRGGAVEKWRGACPYIWPCSCIALSRMVPNWHYGGNKSLS